MSFIRKVQVGKHTYLREVKSIREGGKVKQKYVKHIGRYVNGKAVRQTSSDAIQLEDVKRSLDILSIDKMVNDLKLKSLVENNTALALVYSQLLGQKSINKLEEWFAHTEITDVLGINPSTKQLYNSLTNLSDTRFTGIEEDIFSFLGKYERSSRAAVIDVTDIYFEGKSKGGNPRRGKDGKVRELLQIGLAVTLQHGFPIFHRTYHGNLSNIMVFRDMILRLHHQNIKPIIMDRGMLSIDNLKLLLTLKVPAIAGLRKISSELQKYLSKINREKIYTLKNRVELKNTSVFIKSYSYRKGRLIIVYNPSSEVVKKELSFGKGKKSGAFTGYSLIYHNTELSDHDAVKKYYDKDMIERAFKQIKGILKVRPVRVWLRSHVEGHVRICYLAYAILSLMNYKLRRLKISAVDALESLQYGYRVTLRDKKNGFQWTLTVPLEPDQKKMLKALGVVTKT